MTVETSLHTPGDVNEPKYLAFVAKTIASYKRYRDKANGGSKAYRDYKGWSDAECASAAQFYCRCYREQFRVLVRVA